MPPLKDLEIGVMFWAGGDPLEMVREVKALGVSSGQLGIPGDLPLEKAAAAWRDALAKEDFTVVTVFCGYAGESYADIPTVERTVGFIPPETRAEREERTRDVSDFAAAIGANSIGCHAGCIPANPEDPAYIAIQDLMRRLCDYAAQHGQTFALETGQEKAEVLLEFLKDVDRKNLGVNFDPANMILYGTGDPLLALDVLHEHLLSVHCKDGEWPPKMPAGALGTEMPLGQGAVGVDKFLAKLKQVGYKGTLNIEREGLDDLEQKRTDLRKAVELLRKLLRS
jgi:L-ribulose-5-phosphate 3-epimerase